MRLPLLLYYIYKLVAEGHKWQYQNATMSNRKSVFPFTIPQCLALLISLAFVIFNKNGIDTTTIDLLLSSLSILTGFLIAVAVIVYDKYKDLPNHITSDAEKIDLFKSYNFLRQYNALSMYAILLALVSIIMLLLNLLFGDNLDVGKFTWAQSFFSIDWLGTIVCLTVLLFRFVLIYFIFDFFIISIYAICSLYSFVDLQMGKSKIIVEQYKPRNVKTDYATFSEKYKLWKTIVPGIVIIALAVIYFIFILKGT